MPKPTPLMPIEQPADREVVEKLTEWLEAAKRGEVRGFIGIAFMTGRTQQLSSVGTYSIPEAVYGIEAWKHRELEYQLAKDVDRNGEG